MRRADFMTHLPHWLQRHSLAVGMTCVLSVCTLVGCGRSTPTPTAGHDSKEEGDDTGKSESPKSKKKSQSDGTNQTVAVNANRRMIADIPLDVFFDNPIAESKQVGEVATPSAPKTADAAKPATQPMPPAEKAAEKPAGGAGEWATIITAEDLQDEVKKMRLRLQDNLSAIGKYNAHYNKEIQWDGAGLAALAAIAIVHPDKISWKASAAQIRDAAKEMSAKTKGGLGQKPFEATKKEFEKIDGLLSGNPPPGLPEAAADVPFSDVASRKGLMYGIQNGTEYLRANSQATGPFEKNSEDIARVASIVATYSKVVGTEGYASADEDDYKNFLKPLFEASMTMMKAAKDKDLDTFSKANGPVPKYCSECHTAYAGNGN